MLDLGLAEASLRKEKDEIEDWVPGVVHRAKRQLLQNMGLLEAAPLASDPFRYFSPGPLGLFCFVLFCL